MWFSDININFKLLQVLIMKANYEKNITLIKHLKKWYNNIKK